MKIAFIIFLLLKISFSKKLLEVLNEEKDIKEIFIEEEEEIEYEVKSGESYIFIITNENNFYSFASLIDNIFYKKNEQNNAYELKPNETFFEKGEKICVNISKDLPDTKIKISPAPIYTELNIFETINENQYFFIKSENKSIAYFDSFDKNSKVFISESRQKAIVEEDKRINSKFYEIEQNKIYLVKNIIFDISVFKKYFYPIKLHESEIFINEDNKNFLYLVQNQSYILNFESNTVNKMIKLSTFNSIVKINKEGDEDIKELNKSTPYYKIDPNFKGKLILEVEEDNAFIEFLSDFGDYEILKDEKKEKYQIKKSIEIIKIPFTFKSFEIKLKSDKKFKYSLSFGLTNEEKYYYASNSNLKISSQNNEELLTYLSLFKNIDLLKDEFLSLAIIFEKEENQNIIISYKQFSELDELMDEKLTEERCEKIIKAIQDLLEFYVYLDIAQNPPDVGIPGYHHRKINLKEELGKVSTKNRKFYEFYQEIKTILSVVRDGHLEITPYETPKKIQVGQYYFILPFYFIINEYKGKPRIFITPREDYIGAYDNKTQEFIRNHIDIPIKTINDLDPFDFIQNWTHYLGVKNINSKFVHNIYYISGLYLIFCPLNYTDFMQNEFEFEDNKIIRISFLIGKPIPKNKEFNSFFLKTIKKYKSLRLLPPIDDIKKKYIYMKGIKQKSNEEKEKEEESKLKWDVFFEEYGDYMKCRIDNDKKVNVFVQNNLYMDYPTYYGKILECAKLFHTNNYPIIIIEDRNGGGYPTLSYLMIQLFQMREVERTYSAMRFPEKLKEVFKVEEYEEGFFDPKTCEIISSTDNFTEVIDFYDYSGLNITHRRTNAFVELMSLTERKALNSFRMEYLNSPFLKRPTDIIIFTDGYSFSSASTLIKGFQNIGGAIIVGYGGNPKIEDIDLFDGAQSDSGVMNYPNTYISKNLEEVGFQIRGFTSIEVFDDSYQAKNPIPREYHLNPVDYKVDIYSQYSDDIYDNFVEEGNKIFKKFNEEDYCNYKNKKLLFHDEERKDIENLEHAHGGYKCGDNNKWDKSKLTPYYCDIGFSFDQYFKKCVKDCVSESEAFYIFEDEFSHSYNIKTNEILELIFMNPNGVYYALEASENYIDECPEICIIKGHGLITINKNKQSEKDVLIKVNSSFSDINNIISLKMEEFFNDLFLYKEKTMLIFQSNKEHIIFFNNIFNNETNKIKYAKYNKTMKYKDILNINNKFFIDYSGESFTLDKDETYIIYFNNELSNQMVASINPIEFKKKIISKQQFVNYIYLKKGNNYNLEIKDSLDIMIKLSRNTSNSKISIEDIDNKKNTILKSDNLYYYNNYTNLNIKVEDDDAILELNINLNIYEPAVFDLKNIEFNLNEGINMIKIPKNYKRIHIELNSKDIFEISIYHGYSILPYAHYLEIPEENRMRFNNYSLTISNLYDKKIKLMKDEYYIVMIEIFYGDIEAKISGEKKDDDNGLETYKIILIIVSSVIFIILLFLIICIIRKKKNHSSEEIEKKLIILMKEY